MTRSTRSTDSTRSRSRAENRAQQEPTSEDRTRRHSTIGDMSPAKFEGWLRRGRLGPHNRNGHDLGRRSAPRSHVACPTKAPPVQGTEGASKSWSTRPGSNRRPPRWQEKGKLRKSAALPPRDRRAPARSGTSRHRGRQTAPKRHQTRGRERGFPRSTPGPRPDPATGPSVWLARRKIKISRAREESRGSAGQRVLLKPGGAV
jgi:hypothetical protein